MTKAHSSRLKFWMPSNTSFDNFLFTIKYSMLPTTCCYQHTASFGRLMVNLTLNFASKKALAVVDENPWECVHENALFKTKQIGIRCNGGTELHLKRASKACSRTSKRCCRCGGNTPSWNVQKHGAKPAYPLTILCASLSRGGDLPSAD